jgi:ribosomal protein L29
MASERIAELEKENRELRAELAEARQQSKTADYIKIVHGLIPQTP